MGKRKFSGEKTTILKVRIESAKRIRKFTLNKVKQESKNIDINN
jgi:hypothetical protein